MKRLRSVRFPMHRGACVASLLVAGTIFCSAQAAAPALVEANTALAQRVQFDAGRADESFEGFIIYYQGDAAPGDEKSAAASRTRKVIDADLTRVAKALGTPARHERRLATGGHLVNLVGQTLAGEQARRYMAELAANPAVVSVEPNARATIKLAPNDPHYSRQWALNDPSFGIGAPAAWDIATGSGIVIAVVDTGSTPHPDLDSQTVPGYDFISSATTARDGDGRDADPSDEGDWYENSACGAGAPPSQDSTWHGTHVAGIAAAQTNNGVGVAGVAFGARVQHVRALGRCGGTVADISDAIVWAAGGQVSGVPTNATPARVINLSLGSEGSCGTTYQNAINRAIQRGAVVIAAAGNEDIPAALSRPANCQGVISVGASHRHGLRASYSNHGEGVDIAAPGGDCDNCEVDFPNLILSTLNDGDRNPGDPVYAYSAGTSMATPHVAGVAALVLSRKGSLTPAQVKTLLRDTARPFTGHCDKGCGVGLLNAEDAARAAANQAITRLPLTVTRLGNGDGRITSSPSGIDCGTRCSTRFNKGASVVLTAAGTSGSQFAGWSGACAAAGNATTCTLTADQAHAAFASFKLPVQALTRGTAQSGISAQNSGKRMFSLEVPAGASNLTFKISGGSGDADLYVRRGEEPTESDFDCRPFRYGNNEQCEFKAPLAGTYFVMIQGDPSFSGVRLMGHYVTGPTGGRTLQVDTPVRNLSAPAGGGLYFKITVPQGASDLWITTHSNQDLDLFARRGAIPSPDWSEEFASGNWAGNESIYVRNPSAGTYYLLLHAYDEIHNATLAAGYTASGKRVTVTHTGLGAGEVSFTRAATGATGASSCLFYPCVRGLPNASFDLGANASNGSRFNGWKSGECDSITSNGKCRARASVNRSITAHFVQAPARGLLAINTSGNGKGAVMVANGMADPPRAACTAFPCRGEKFTDTVLIPVAEPGSVFQGWGRNDCHTITLEGYCKVRAGSASTVTASFSK